MFRNFLNRTKERTSELTFNVMFSLISRKYILTIDNQIEFSQIVRPHIGRFGKLNVTPELTEKLQIFKSKLKKKEAKKDG